MLKIFLNNPLPSVVAERRPDVEELESSNSGSARDPRPRPRPKWGGVSIFG